MYVLCGSSDEVVVGSFVLKGTRRALELVLVADTVERCENGLIASEGAADETIGTAFNSGAALAFESEATFEALPPVRPMESHQFCFLP
jgi:hypothetical protein